MNYSPVATQSTPMAQHRLMTQAQREREYLDSIRAEYFPNRVLDFCIQAGVVVFLIVVFL